MIEGELRSETIERFAKLKLYYIPKNIFLALVDLIDLCEVSDVANELAGDYVDALLSYLPHLDGRNRDDIIRILHGHQPTSKESYVPVGVEGNEGKKRLKIF